MADSIYDSLPEDSEQAFVLLERHFREELDGSLRGNDEGSYDAYCKRRYMSRVIAAAKSLGIPGIKDFVTPANNRQTWDVFEQFETDLTDITVQIEINHGRRRRNYSVAFDGSTKRKIRHYIEQIRISVEKSDLSQAKRDAIFKRLAELNLEVDRSRTRFEVVADAVRGVARLSGDIEREGAEPWWKWVKLLFGEIDEAKEKEPQPSIPAPEERKRIEPPRKGLPKPSNSHSQELDDEIPF